MKIKTGIRSGGLAAINHNVRLVLFALVLAACSSAPREDVGTSEEALGVTQNIYVLRLKNTGSTVAWETYSDTGEFATTLKQMSLYNSTASGTQGVSPHFVVLPEISATPAQIGCNGNDAQRVVDYAAIQYHNTGTNFSTARYLFLPQEAVNTYGGPGGCGISSSGGPLDSATRIVIGAPVLTSSVTSSVVDGSSGPATTVRTIHEWGHGGSAVGLFVEHADRIAGCAPSAAPPHQGKYSITNPDCVVSELFPGGISQFYVDPMGINQANLAAGYPDLAHTHFSAAYMWEFGWFTTSRVAIVGPNVGSNTQTTPAVSVNLSCSDTGTISPADPSNKIMVLVERPDGRGFVFEHRCNLPVNEGFAGNGTPHANVPGIVTTFLQDYDVLHPAYYVTWSDGATCGQLENCLRILSDGGVNDLIWKVEGLLGDHAGLRVSFDHVGGVFKVYQNN